MKKVYVIYAIFSVLQTSVIADKKCKKGLSLEDDREGSLEEVKGSLGEEMCQRDIHTCMSIRVDEIEIEGNKSEY